VLVFVLLTAVVALSRLERLPPTTTIAFRTGRFTPSPAATATAHEAATATPTAIAAAAPEVFVPPEPTPTPVVLVSEVLPVTQAPSEPPAAPAEPTPIPGGTYLPVPDGTTVVWGGCSSDGECHDYNFYWAPTHEVVMQNGEGEHKVQHEQCHAHQHWSINGGAPLAPSDYDLESWYSTAEGQSFAAAVAGLPWVWSHSAVNGLEDFAWTCAYWYYDPAYLLEASLERYDWAAANLP